jgi:RNA polymerase sigma-70 factor (ECF subfamily)
LRSHGKEIWKVALESGDDWDDAEDLYQMTVTRAWERRGSYRGEGPVSAWFYRVAKNLCAGERRKRARHRRLRELLAGIGLPEEMPWTPPSPLEESLSAEADEILLRAMMRLSPREREAIDLRVRQEKTYKEAALVMKITEATVRSLVRNARPTLKELMNELSGS